jgi:hypothetical protein
MPKIDLAALIQGEIGGEVIGPGSSPTTVRVKLPAQSPVDPAAQRPELAGMDFGAQQEEVEMDAAALLKDMGEDPTKFEFQIGTKDVPLSDNSLSFKDRFLYEVAHTPKDKANFLKEKFGEENVAFDSDVGSFRYKEGNTWYDADKTGIAGFLGADGDVIAGATSFGIAGTMVGGPLVGIPAAGIGAVVARLGTIDSAKQAGIRSEQDASELVKELGTEAVLAMLGEATVPALRGGVSGIKAMNRALAKGKVAAGSIQAKDELAMYMSQNLGLDIVDSHNWLDRVKEIEPLQKQVIAWRAKGAKDVNPLQKEMADMVQGAVETTKKTMYRDYDKVMSPMRAATRDLKVDVQPVLDDMVGEFKRLGLIDDQGRWMSRDIKGIVDPRSLGKLKQTYDILKRAPKVGKATKVDDMQTMLTQVSFEDAQTLVSNVDEILEAAGQYRLSGSEITTPAKAKIVGIRAGLKNAVRNSLKSRGDDFVKQYDQLNSTYSKRRAWLDDMTFATADERVDGTLKSMLNTNGGRQREQMVEILKGTSIDPDDFMNSLFDRRTAINTAMKFTKESSGKPAYSAAWNRLTAPERLAPLKAKQWDKIQTIAKRNEFLLSMPEAQRKELLKNPKALKTLNQITMQALTQQDQVEQDLTSRATGQ